MRGKILRAILFIVTILVTILLLKIFNWLPTAFQKDTMRRYNSIEEVRARLSMSDIPVPSYFPQRFKWPPSQIFAQGKPYSALVMEFRDEDKKNIALVISQSAAGSGFVPDKKINIVKVKEKVRYPINGRDALLEVGTCKDEEPCSRISWKEGKYDLMIEAKSAPFDLIKIANSMMR